MAETTSSLSSRWLPIVLLTIAIVAIVVASLLQRPAPSGVEIVGKAVPHNHPPGACYNCHGGMPPATAITGKRLPQRHPSKDCSQCHEGYRADPGLSQPIPPLPPAGSPF
ncbi:MAG: hypothetical protein ACUVX8_18515 [Candidatus Zipacnadales bacterium]